MTVRTLLVPSPLHPGLIFIDGDEAHHGRTVLRLRMGDLIRLADGAGSFGNGTVIEVHRECIQVRVDDVQRVQPGLASLVTVVCAIPKGDRFADMVRQLTELGIGKIQPLICERGEKMSINEARLRRICGEALKQSRRSHLPIIGQAIDIVGLATCADRLIILDQKGVSADPGQPAPVTLVIGPEGGLTPLEIDTLLAARATRVRLAASILRIETAALAAAAVWVATWEGQSHE